MYTNALCFYDPHWCRSLKQLYCICSLLFFSANMFVSSPLKQKCQECKKKSIPEFDLETDSTEIASLNRIQIWRRGSILGRLSDCAMEKLLRVFDGTCWTLLWGALSYSQNFNAAWNINSWSPLTLDWRFTVLKDQMLPFLTKHTEMPCC